MTITRHLSANDLKLRAPGNLTPEQKAKWNAAYDPKNKAFEEAKLEGDELLKWKYQRYVKDYLRCIDSVDENIGRFLDYLDKSGLAENTVVIYSSDQGWYLGEHGWYDKRWMYEESFRTPLIAPLAGGNPARQQKPRPRAKPRLCRDLSRSLRGQAPQGYARRINRSFAEGQETQRLEKVSLLSLL